MTVDTGIISDTRFGHPSIQKRQALLLLDFSEEFIGLTNLVLSVLDLVQIDVEFAAIRLDYAFPGTLILEALDLSNDSHRLVFEGVGLNPLFNICNCDESAAVECRDH